MKKCDKDLLNKAIESVEQIYKDYRDNAPTDYGDVLHIVTMLRNNFYVACKIAKEQPHD